MGADITVQELSDRLNRGDKPFILDVREEFEYDIINLGGLIIPLPDLENRLYEIEDYRDAEVVVYCKNGNRSGDAVRLLDENGFSNARNLVGGINEWARKIDPSMKEY